MVWQAIKYTEDSWILTFEKWLFLISKGERHLHSSAHCICGWNCSHEKWSWRNHSIKSIPWWKIHYLLRMEIIKVPNGFIMTQRKFTMELLREFQCDKFTTTSCPLASLTKESSNKDTLINATNYRKLVGKLNYLTNTRPDIAFSVQYPNQFL